MSRSFSYYAPTRVYFGKDTELAVGKILKEYKVNKVLIHYGGSSAIKSGLIDKVTRALDENNISYYLLGGVVPNPRLSLVYKGVELAKKNNIDFILAVGGGSVIDSAKAIGYGVKYDNDVWDFYDFNKKTPTDCLPIGVILTIAAAGSEMSNSSVITNDKLHLKHGNNNDLCRPRFAIMNPELTYSLPKYQTACGTVDIAMHTMERYFNNENNLDITDNIAEGLIRACFKHGLILMDNPNSYESRAELMWASSLSHNGLTGCGTDGGDWTCHRLEHELGALFDCAHGAGLAAIWPTWAKYVYKENPKRFAKFAVNALGLDPVGSDEELALRGIARVEEIYKSLGMPIRIHELGIYPTEEEFITMASNCSKAFNDCLGSIKKLHYDDFLAILKMAM